MAPNDQNDCSILGNDIFNSGRCGGGRGEAFKSQRFQNYSGGETVDGKIELTFRRWLVENQGLVLSELHMVITEINELVSIPGLQCLAPQRDCCYISFPISFVVIE